MSINTSDISRLREQTGAGILDCKKALEEAGGNYDSAVDILRKLGGAKAAKRAGKIAAEGVVVSYIHGQNKIATLVELNCETDFVAKNDKFVELAKDIAMHIVAASPIYLNREEVPVEVVTKERDIYREQLRTEGKPDEIIEKILEGKLNKFYSEICLMDQSYVKDEDKTIAELLTTATAEIGEKISLRRFARYEVGEGMEKKSCDFVAEVAEQMEK
ncbi:MAG: translation elongation factor Ts [Candidatus Magasanikbacteria bacterium]|nr:translation elongation factor Ts [Candidatus Magasanikbacteria bacterium]